MSYEQAELRRWIARLVKAHGSREVAAVLWFETEADFLAWQANPTEIDPNDVFTLVRKWGVGLMDSGDFEEAERG